MPRLSWKIRTETALNLVQTAAIVVGLVFGLRQLGELERGRELAATLQLVGAFQDETVSAGVLRLTALPPDVTPADLAALPTADRDLVLGLAGTWESLGILVHRGDVSLELADELFGALVVMSWDRLGPWVEGQRMQSADPQVLEWFQWLAERLAERRAGPAGVPAYEAHRDWRPG